MLLQAHLGGPLLNHSTPLPREIEYDQRRNETGGGMWPYSFVALLYGGGGGHSGNLSAQESE